MRATLALVVALAVIGTGCSSAVSTDELNAAVQRYQLSRIQLASAQPPAEAAAPLTDAQPSRAEWLSLGNLQLAQAEQSAPDAEGSAAEGTQATAAAADGWRTRHGPAYPGEFWRNIGRDAKDILPSIWDDTKATATNPWSLAGLAAAGVAGIAINGTGVDETVARQFRRNGSALPGWLDTVGDVGGNPGTHFAIAGAMYITSLARDDKRTFEVSQAAINALAINGLVTLGLKAAVRTESPNGDEFGWPSGHASSSFAFATVLNEYYGPWVGLPAFAFATFVAYERIDARNHDFSDVVSGALIGMAIGYAVSQNHMPRVMGMEVAPYVDPNGGAGVALIKRW